jgi:hypothetical protein
MLSHVLIKIVAHILELYINYFIIIIHTTTLYINNNIPYIIFVVVVV